MPLLGPGSAQQRYALQRVRDTKFLLADAEKSRAPDAAQRDISAFTRVFDALWRC